MTGIMRNSVKKCDEIPGVKFQRNSVPQNSAGHPRYEKNDLERGSIIEQIKDGECE